MLTANLKIQLSNDEKRIQKSRYEESKIKEPPVILEQKIYDTFVQFYANKMGITNTYKAKNKREYLPQRQRL
jgi:hypothetical protein